MADNKVENILIEIKIETKKMLLCAAYRPNNRIELKPFINILENLSTSYQDVIVIGDFNSNLLVDSQLTDEMRSLGLTPTNTTTPSHFSKTNSTLLDVIFVANQSNVLLYDQLSAPCFSKHDLLFLSYDFQLSTQEQVITYRDFKNINYNLLLQEFSKIDWARIYYIESIDEELLFLNQNVNCLFDAIVPTKTKFSSRNVKPWFSNNIKQQIIKRDIAYSRWKRFKTTELHNEYRSTRNATNILIRDAKSSYFATKFLNAIDSKQTWKNIREIGIGKSKDFSDININANSVNEKFVNIPTVSANLSFYLNNNPTQVNQNHEFNFIGIDLFDVCKFCSFVKSNAIGSDEMNPKFLKILLPLLLPIITHIFNKIITFSNYPESWKVAKIIPIPKTKSDYRPIAILPFLSKVFEKILYNQIMLHLNAGNLITDRQSGFRANHSCTTALIDVAEDIRREIDKRNLTFLVLLDHSKAFDTVDHTILEYKLRNLFNFSVTSTRLLMTYLSNRYQYVHTSTGDSECLAINRGVPQGSIIGPLLFSLYANDLPNQLQFCKVRMYADDVQIYISCNLISVNECVSKLNQDLNRIQLWAAANGLSINPHKSKCIIIKKRSTVTEFMPHIVLNNQDIEIVKSTKNLGIFFNDNLNWKDHVNYACGRTYSLLRSLWKTQPITPLKIRMLLAKTYLIPTLLYGCEIFASCDTISNTKLKVLFNNIARYIFNLRGRVNISTYSRQIYGVSFNNLLKAKVLIFLHKIILTKKPDHLYERLIFSRSNRGRRITTLYYNSLSSEWQFFIYAIRLWNSLPHNVQIVSTAAKFKKCIFEMYL